MPSDKILYADNWNQIAQEQKEAAGWICQNCGRACRKTGESWENFQRRLNWTPAEDDKPGQYVLTVAHLDQKPHNNELSNLKALCTVCHLRHDTPYRQLNRYAKRERWGQLRLEGVG
jgi:hypothetical protein